MSYFIFKDRFFFYGKSKFIYELKTNLEFYEKFIKPNFNKFVDEYQIEKDKLIEQAYGEDCYSDESPELFELIEEYNSSELSRYSNTSMNIVNIINLWEMQVCIFTKTNDFNKAKDALKEKFLYDFSKNDKLIEIRLLNNFLKHGLGGFAESKLIKMNSKYIPEYDDSGSTTTRLNITCDDVKKITQILIGFWEDIDKNYIQNYKVR